MFKTKSKTAANFNKMLRIIVTLISSEPIHCLQKLFGNLIASQQSDKAKKISEYKNAILFSLATIQ